MTVTSPHRGVAPPWGIWATIGWLVVAFLVSTLVAVACYSLWQSEHPRHAATPFDGVLIAIGAIVSVPMQIAVLSLAARVRGWSTPDYFALNLPRRSEVIVAIVCVIALDVVFNLLLLIAGQDLVTPFQVEAYRSAKEAGWLFWLLVAIVVFAPIGEEIAFRGFLYRGLARPGYELHAIALIAVAWAAMHVQYDWVGILQVFAIGLLLGWIRWASGSTLLTILMHMLINAEAMIETAIKVEYLS